MIPGPLPFETTAPEVDVAALLKAQTPWSEWLQLTGEGPISWPYVVALLMRNVDIRDVILPVTLALEAAASRVEAACVRTYAKAPDAGPVGFLDWMALWQDRPERAPLRKALKKLARKHKGDAAAGLLALCDEEAESGAAMWFLIGAFAEWLAMAGPSLRASILDDHDWIAEIAGRNADDAVAQVYASLYEAFVARGACPASPLMIDVAAYLAAFHDSAHRTLYRRQYAGVAPFSEWLHAARQNGTEGIALLGRGPQWPEAAANIVATRDAGYMTPDALKLIEAAADKLEWRPVGRIARRIESKAVQEK